MLIVIGIQGCAIFPEKHQDKDSYNNSEISMSVEESKAMGESSIPDAELLSMFPQFARKWQGMQKLAKARVLMLNGYHSSSLRGNKEVLRLFPRSLGDQALFQMGLNYAHSGNPDRNYKKSKKCFQRILKEYPDSDIRDKAGIWVLFLQEMIEKNREINNLQNQLEGLQYQIERLKEVDLGIEEKKRELLLN